MSSICGCTVTRYASSSAERAKSQEAQLRGAINDHYVVCFRNRLNRRCHAGEEHLLAGPSLASEYPWCFVFEFLEFEVPRDDI